MHSIQEVEVGKAFWEAKRDSKGDRARTKVEAETMCDQEKAMM